MKNFVRLLALAVLVAVSYMAGTWHSRGRGKAEPHVTREAVVYYRCPMHPDFKSENPGIAPCCGMKFEPVFASPSSARARTDAAGVPAAIRISPDRRQIIGVRSVPVERVARAHSLKLLGRVGADSSRVYPLRTSADGWIRRTYADSVGSLVKKGQILATFYPPGLRSAQLYYFQALNGASRRPPAVDDSRQESLQALTDARVQQAADGLRQLGMQEEQIEELAGTRQPASEVVLRAPHTGFVLAREVYPGLRFEKGAELYRIVDLSRVWITADVFESDAGFLPARFEARIFHPQLRKSFGARSSDILPQFDPASRTLKVRLEADNPGFILKPDMLVDVEVAIDRGTGLVVPVDAVLDSGVKQTVFVDCGDGFFEPRQVETGWNADGRVEILKGLSEGERVVLSGNFLLDSESRLREAVRETGESSRMAGKPGPDAP